LIKNHVEFNFSKEEEFAGINLPYALELGLSELKEEQLEGELLVKIAFDGRNIGGEQVSFGLVPVAQIIGDVVKFSYEKPQSPKNIIPFLLMNGKEDYDELEKLKVFFSDIKKIEEKGRRMNILK